MMRIASDNFGGIACRLGILLTAAVCALASRSVAQTPDPDDARTLANQPLTVRGTFTLDYRARWTRDDSDHDLDSLLSLDIGERDRDPVTGYLLVRGIQDLDGDQGEGPFQSIADTYDHSTHGIFYQGYVDVWIVPQLERARLGRQIIYDTPEFAHLDGAYLTTPTMGEWNVELGFYGGSSVHLYESSPHGDAVAGVFARAEPWRHGKVRFDWMYARDDERFGINRNHLLQIALWQRLTDNIQLHGYYARIEEDDRDMLLRGTYFEQEADIKLEASYYRLFEEQSDFAQEFDPYYQQLQEFFPYHQVDFLMSKGFDESFVIDAGATVRDLDDADDEGAFNREFERYYITPTLIYETLSASITGDLWYSDGQDTRTFGFDLSNDFDDAWTGSIGTYYSLFKYDLFTDSERDHVRTYYVKVDHELREGIDLDLEATYEDDEFDDWYGLKAGLRWTF